MCSWFFILLAAFSFVWFPFSRKMAGAHGSLHRSTRAGAGHGAHAGAKDTLRAQATRAMALPVRTPLWILVRRSRANWQARIARDPQWATPPGP